MAAAQQQKLMEDFACFTDPQLKPGQGTITIGDLCVSPVTHARGGISHHPLQVTHQPLICVLADAGASLGQESDADRAAEDHRAGS